MQIDSSLFEKIDEVLNKDENKYKFVNKKHFIDLAVYEFLEKINKGTKNGGEKR